MPPSPRVRSILAVASVAATAALTISPLISGASATGQATVDHHHKVSSAAARLDAANLRAAATAVENEALDSGALSDPLPDTTPPATVLMQSSDALLADAQRTDAGRGLTDTEAVMGLVPQNLLHRPKHHPAHHRVTLTHVFTSFVTALVDHGSRGWGLHRRHDGARPAVVQKPDGVYVDPTLPALTDPTVPMVAIRAALQKLGQPYVWAGAGPAVFDCSGLTQWAYAKAGIKLGHYTGWQWNEGALVPVRDILPGDLILFEYETAHGEYIHHVGMYLGAGWMINAPYTGQYVNVVPVESGVAGVIRP